MTCPACDCPDSYTDDNGITRCSACYQHLGVLTEPEAAEPPQPEATETETPAVRKAAASAPGRSAPIPGSTGDKVIRHRAKKDR